MRPSSPDLQDKIVSIYRTLYDNMQCTSDSQTAVRTLAFGWILSIFLAVGSLITTNYYYLVFSPEVGIALVCWAGIFGLLPLCLIDLLQYQMFKRAIQIDIDALEHQYEWLPKVQAHILKLRPVKGFVIYGINLFYMSCFVVLIIISCVATVLEVSSTNLSLLIGLGFVHVAGILGTVMYYRLLLCLNEQIYAIISPGNYQPQHLSGKHWNNIWKGYEHILIFSRFYFTKIVDNKKNTSKLFLFIYSIMGFALATPENLLRVEKPLLISITALIGLVFVLIFWRIDAGGYQKYYQALALEGLEIEKAIHGIPRHFHNLIKITTNQSISIAALLYYVYSQLLCLTTAIGCCFWLWSVFPLLILGVVALTGIFSPLLFLAIMRGSTKHTILSIKLSS